MILSLTRSVLDRRISPASDRLSALFLRWGAPPQRLNRPRKLSRGVIGVKLPTEIAKINLTEHFKGGYRLKLSTGVAKGMY